VGGRIEVVADELRFTPNRMNVKVHADPVSVTIRLSSIRSVDRVFGWFTGIVLVEHEEGVFRFRCYNARKVAGRLSEVVGGWPP